MRRVQHTKPPDNLAHGAAHISRAALHEAGHVVMALHLGWPAPLRIEVGGIDGGSARWHPDELAPDGDDAGSHLTHTMDHALVSLAGVTAEIIVMGGVDASLAHGGAPDLARTDRLADEMAAALETDPKKITAGLVSDVDAIMRDPATWRAVLTLAAALESARVLAGPELARALDATRLVLEGGAP